MWTLWRDPSPITRWKDRGCSLQLLGMRLFKLWVSVTQQAKEEYQSLSHPYCRKNKTGFLRVKVIAMNSVRDYWKSQDRKGKANGGGFPLKQHCGQSLSITKNTARAPPHWTPERGAVCFASRFLLSVQAPGALQTPVIPRISQRPGPQDICTQSSFPQPQGNWWEAGLEPRLLSGSLKQRGHNSSFLESNHWDPTCALFSVPEEGSPDHL